MVVAIILGIIVGILGFLPLILGMKLARNATPTSNVSYTSGLLLGVFGSFAILAIAAIVCIVAFRAYALPFVLAMAASLVIAAIVYGVLRQLR